MEIRKILVLRGPNVWSRHPVLEAWVDLHELKDSPSTSIPGFNDRLMNLLPTMIEHRCSYGERGGFFQRLRDGTYPAHILEHVSIELQTLAGTPVGFGKARETSEEGVYKVVMRFRDEQVARACLMAGRELLLSAIYDRPYDVAAEVKKLKALVDRVCLGPSTLAIVSAAEARGIPARRLNAGSLVQLGHGARQRRIWTAETDRTSAIAESIAQDKELTKSLLRAVGVPVPEGRGVDTPEDAWEAAQEIGLPVVVKPRDANHARGVSTNLTSRDEIEKAFQAASKEGSGVIVERFARGEEHRLLVVGDRLVAAVKGEAVTVTADGRSTLRQLIDDQLNSDPRRGDDETFPLSLIEYDAVTLLQLERQGFTPESVPPAGQVVLVQRNDNLSIDVTDEVHPTVAEHAVLAAKTVGLDIAGLDIVAKDISRPLEEQGAVVVEVNAGPGLVMHLKPSVGQPRPVGEAIVGMLFSPGQSGRIPIVSVTGTNGKSTVVRLINHLLTSQGVVVGETSTDGIRVAGRLIEGGDCSGPRSARKVLLNPLVEAAVFESGRGGILREGLGFDRCDVAVVTNLGRCDHLGQAYIDTPEQMWTVKRCGVDVVLPTGMAVLNAEDPQVASMAELSAGGVTFFSLDCEHEVLLAHVKSGGRCVFVEGQQLVVASGGVETMLLPLSQIPLTREGRVPFQTANVLAAVGAAWHLGLTFEQIREGLQTFGRDDPALPGRFQRFEAGGVAVIVDDCHNVDSLEAVCQALANEPSPRSTAIYSAGRRRRASDLIDQGRLLARNFDRVFIYHDSSCNDRSPAETAELFRAGARQEGSARCQEWVDIPDVQQAFQTALASSQAGEVVLVQTEDDEVESAVRWVSERLGVSGNVLGPGVVRGASSGSTLRTG
ncbi:MAG: cyanophycin synthetase [Planctomycetaceae bacterium]